MKFFILFVLLLVAPAAMAGELRLLELDAMSMEFGRIANNRDAYFPYEDPSYDRFDTAETWDSQVAAKFDLALLAFRNYRMHWDNKITGAQTSVQFRQVTWDFRWGLELGNRLELYYDHTSSHLLDQSPEGPRRYTLKNVYGAAINFYRRKP